MPLPLPYKAAEANLQHLHFILSSPVNFSLERSCSDLPQNWPVYPPVGIYFDGELMGDFCRNGFCVSGSWHMARSPRTNTLLGRSTGLLLLIAVPIPSITWTGANKNKDKQNSSAEFVVQQGYLLVLCNNTRLYQADTVSIISVSSGKVTGQKACIFNGFTALAPYSHPFRIVYSMHHAQQNESPSKPQYLPSAKGQLPGNTNTDLFSF